MSSPKVDKEIEEINHIELSDSEVNQIKIQIDQGTKSLEDEELERELKAIMEDDGGKKKKKRKKFSRKMKIGITLAVVAAGAFLLFKNMSASVSTAPVVATTPLAKGDVVQKLSINGPVEGTDSVEVVSNLHTEILEIPVKEGDRVTKDQVLAVLDSKDIAREVEMAQNAYDLAVTTYDEKNQEAANGYAKARQDYNTAKGEYDRQSVLFQAGSISQVELEQASNLMNDAKRQLSSFNIENGKAVANDSYRLEIESRAFDLEQKKRALENTQVTSPIDGTVVRVNCKVGRFADKVDDDKPMFMIDNLDVLQMKIKVSEYSIGKVAVGQPVSITADILNGESVRGEVVSISPTGEEKGGGSTERVIPTTIRILDQDTKLIAGITARAEIILAEAKDAWAVPISALLLQEDGSYCVQAVVDGLVKNIPVTTDVESDVTIEVIPVEEGSLSDGMAIITNANIIFTEGMAVAVMPGM